MVLDKEKQTQETKMKNLRISQTIWSKYTEQEQELFKELYFNGGQINPIRSFITAIKKRWGSIDNPAILEIKNGSVLIKNKIYHWIPENWTPAHWSDFDITPVEPTEINEDLAVIESQETINEESIVDEDEITEKYVHSALQNGFYQKGDDIIQVRNVGRWDLTVTHKIFGELRGMSWETFEDGYKLIDCERWIDVPSFKEKQKELIAVEKQEPEIDYYPLDRVIPKYVAIFNLTANSFSGSVSISEDDIYHALGNNLLLREFLKSILSNTGIDYIDFSLSLDQRIRDTFEVHLIDNYQRYPLFDLLYDLKQFADLDYITNPDSEIVPFNDDFDFYIANPEAEFSENFKSLYLS